MPRREPAVADVPAQLRRLQARLPELSVPVLLRLRDQVEPLLERHNIGVADARAVLRAAGER